MPFDKSFDHELRAEWLKAPNATEGLSLPAGRQGLTLHFDKLSVLSLS